MMLLLGYTMPTVLSVSYAATQSGGGFLGSTSDGLTDGIPARKARLQWMSVAGNTSDHIRIPMYFTGANVALRVVCVLGLTLPVGVRLQIDLVSGHTGLNLVAQLSSRAVKFADGTVGAWFVFPASAPSANRCDLLIYNDVSGVASIAAGTVFDIGEVAAMPALEIEIEREWGDERIDPTESELSRDSQPLSVARQSYRRYEMTLVADSAAAVRGGGLAGGMDWDRLRAACFGDSRVIAIPRWQTPAGAVDAVALHATAIYGVGRLGRVTHLGGDYYNAPMTFQEAPAIP